MVIYTVVTIEFYKSRQEEVSTITQTWYMNENVMIGKVSCKYGILRVLIEKGPRHGYLQYS